jgi:AraC family transcriptional regulator, transcriptional activator of pobA
MLPTVAAPRVPIYSLAQTSRDGAADFEIAQHSGLTDHQKDLFFVPHRKDFYLLALVLTGGSRHWVDMVPVTGKPDTLFFSSPEQVILKEAGMLEAISICFTREFLELAGEGQLTRLPILSNPHRGHQLQLSDTDLAFVQDLCARMKAEYERRDGWRNSMLLAYLRVLLIYLSRLYTEQFAAAENEVDRELLRRFRQLLDLHLGEAHEVAAYASMLHVSARHLGEVIRRQSGKTAIELIQDRLLLEAKRLLFHTESSMKEIAFELGFGEASYFNRFFKKRHGSTPLSYRQAMRKMYH